MRNAAKMDELGSMNVEKGSNDYRLKKSFSSENIRLLRNNPSLTCEQGEILENESRQTSPENNDCCKDVIHRKSKHERSISIPVYMYGQDLRNKPSALASKYYTLQARAITGGTQIFGAAKTVAKKLAEYSHHLISWCDLPDWLKDNSYIHRHYRPPLLTFRRCFKSIFSIHTETGNIWTHIIGLVGLIIAAIFILVRPHTTEDHYPYYPLGMEEIMSYMAFFVGAWLCLTFSWLFHTLCCHSAKVNKLFAKLDYSGISFLIGGSMVPCFYYSWYCERTLKIVYMTIALVLTVTCIVVSLWDIMATPAFRPVRAGVFLAFGLSSIVPIVHHAATHPFKYTVHAVQLYLMIAMGSCYVVGCMLYILMIPERFFPGKLNLVLQSHQIFHVLVVVGASLHLYGICRMSSFRARKGRICYANETDIALTDF